MLPTESTAWLFLAGAVLGLMCGCTSLDDRTVTLHNGEQCNEREQCESLHCELAAENDAEQSVHICCSIRCASGSACAPSGTSCAVCVEGECQGACQGDECTTGGKLEDGEAVEAVSPVAPERTVSGRESVASAAPTTTSPPNVDAGPAVAATGDIDVTDTGLDTAALSGQGSSASAASIVTTSTAPTTEATIPPEQIPECDEPLLINGDFENEMQAWTEEGSYVGLSQRVHPMVVADDDDSVSAYDAVAQSGSYFAYVGGVPDDADRGHHSAIVQSIIVPTDAVGLWLRGYVWVTTDDTLDDEYDFGFIQLERTATDENYRQFQFWTNQDVTTGWVEFEAVIEQLDDLPGKEIRFLVGSISDEMGATRFWFDRLELEGLCP